MEISAKSFFVSAKGGTIDFVRDGEVLASVAVPPGRVPAMDYLGLVPRDCDVEISEGLAVLDPPSRIGVARHDAALETGANPDFQPTSATRLEVQMRLMMNQMLSESREKDARLRALESVERMPTRQAEPEREVIEKAVEPTKEASKADG